MLRFRPGVKNPRALTPDGEPAPAPLPSSPLRCLSQLRFVVTLFYPTSVRVVPPGFVPCGGSVTKSCLTLGDPMDCSLPGSSVHGIFQARILEWIAIPFSRDLPNPGIEPTSLALQAESLPLSQQGKCTVVLHKCLLNK